MYSRLDSVDEAFIIIRQWNSINRHPRMLRIAIILAVVSYALATKLHVVHEWKYVDYVWDCEEQKDKAIAENRYNYTKVFVMDLHEAEDGRMFVTTPALNPNAVPASLSTVSRKKGPGGPLLKPYPDWCWHNSKNCKGMTSVWRITVDNCNRLWVADSGEVGDQHPCPAQLLVFDLGTDKLIQRIKVPDNIARSSLNKTVGRLSYPVVETEGTNCERTWVYMADNQGRAIVIYDGSNLWRVNDELFQHFPARANFCVAGDNFSLTNGISGLALTPGKTPDSRRLFFRPIGSLREYSVSVGDLRRSVNANKNVCYNTSKFSLPSPVVGQSVSRDAIMFFVLTTQLAVACWNVNTPMDKEHVLATALGNCDTPPSVEFQSPQSVTSRPACQSALEHVCRYSQVIVAQDDETLQFANGVKITSYSRDLFKEKLWISTNHAQKTYVGGRNFDEINYRIVSASVDTLVKGTKCQLRKGKHT